MFKLKIAIFFILTIITLQLKAAEPELNFKLGYAYNETEQAANVGGVPYPVIPVIRTSTHNLIFGISTLFPVNQDWKIGVGTSFSLGDIPLDQSKSVWLLDIVKIEYRVYNNFSVRASFGAGKQFQSKVGYGKQSQLEFLYQLSNKTKIGLSQIQGDSDQEQADGTPEYLRGHYKLISAFFEYQF